MQTENNIDTTKYTALTLEQLREGQAKIISKKDMQVTETYPRQLREDGLPEQTYESILESAVRMASKSRGCKWRPMEYDAAKLIVWKIGNTLLSQFGKTWDVDEKQSKVIENLVRYFINDPTGKYDPLKGIYLFGDVGRGKTFLFNVIDIFLNASRFTPMQFKTGNCAEISDRVLWAKDETEGVINTYCANCWLFDDLGNEPSAIKSYGNEFQVMEKILMRRHQRFMKEHFLTHATSNDTPDELEKKYGTRLADRAKEMFNFVALPGINQRK